MSNLDVIRERLDDDKYTDLKEVASTLLAALESIEHACELSDKSGEPQEYRYVAVGALRQKINYWVDELAEETASCAHETYRATLETPAEYCEEDSVPGSEYCKEHSE